jgi:hypothetical protein
VNERAGVKRTGSNPDTYFIFDAPYSMRNFYLNVFTFRKSNKNKGRR